MYNVELFIERCIESLENQDLPKSDYEIICINDGSPDKCKETVVRLQERYSNIILINQENQGVSKARNRGIEVADSKYLLFIDPDDCIRENTLGIILNHAEDSHAQVSFLGFTFLNADGSARQEVLYDKLSGITYNGIEAYFMTRKDDPPDPDRLWAVLIDREFMKNNGLRFLPGVPYLEDGELITRLLCLADKCIFDSRPFYIRTTRKGSATNSNLFYSPRATEGFILAAINLKEFQKNESLNERQREFLNQPIIKYVTLTIDSARKPFLIKRIKEVSVMLKKAGFSSLNLKGVNPKYTRLGWVYNQRIWLLLCYQCVIRMARSFNYRIMRRYSNDSLS